MCSDRGFTLIEVLVATLVGLAMVVGVGLLGRNAIHQRITADANSAATTIAQKQMERLLTLDPTGFTNGTQVVGNVDSSGDASVGGPFTLQYVVGNGPTTNSKRLTVTVTHLTNPAVRCDLVTYVQTS